MKCPTCDKDTKWQDNPYRPFCSERCKLVDLGRWVTEEYRVPGREMDPAKLPHDEPAADRDDVN